jgi:hypothetical protein
MNIASLLAGDMVTELGMQAASKLFQGVMKNNSNFSSILDKLPGTDKTINIEDLDLSKEEEAELTKIRELAMNKGLTDIEVMIDGSKFNLNVKESTLTAVVSYS